MAELRTIPGGEIKIEESAMAYQKVFQRYEIKYMITEEQKAKILEAMAPYMVMDKYGESTIRNIYFDSDDYILARHSIAKPDYKEKLRVRSYSRAGADDTVFVELKRKYDGVVYKRRVALPEADAMAWTSGERKAPRSDSSRQMTEEIDYFLSRYGNLHPAAFLSYDREAYKMKKPSKTVYGSSLDRDFRVTFDSNVICRDYDLSLDSEVYGTQILAQGMYLMELKCSGGIPVWMTQILSELKVYKTSFSKYGTAYCMMIFPTLREQSGQEREKVRATERPSVPGKTRTAAPGAGFRAGTAAAYI